MSTTLQGLRILSLFILATIIFQGCAKEEAIIEPVQEPSEELVNETPFELYLTDCPFEAEEVNVEITGVILEDQNGEREALITNAGIFNLLNFTNGLDTLLAYGSLSIDNIKNIYIELGTQNTIVVDGETFPLQLIQDNIVKIKVDLERIDQLEFLVDFFACTSIIENANGFFLKPVIKFLGERDHDTELAEDLIESFEKCYSIDFPISLININDEILTANDRTELIDIIISNEIKDAVFPVNLLNIHGDPIQVNSLAEARLIDDCSLNENEEEEPIGEIQELIMKLDECYDIVFPISLVNNNGETLEATDIIQLIFIFENNTIEDVVLPIQLIDDNGTTVTINSAVDIAFLDLDC